MSRWLTLNISGMGIEDLPDTFEDLHTTVEGGRIVAYTFRSRSMFEDKMDEGRALAKQALELGANQVVVILAGDTADWVDGTEYLQSPQAGALVEGESWFGEHHYCTDSRVIQEMERYLGYRPNVGGNWSDEKERMEAPTDE